MPEPLAKLDWPVVAVKRTYSDAYGTEQTFTVYICPKCLRVFGALGGRCYCADVHWKFQLPRAVAVVMVPLARVEARDKRIEELEGELEQAQKERRIEIELTDAATECRLTEEKRADAAERRLEGSRAALDSAIEGERELRDKALNDRDGKLIHGSALSALASFRAALDTSEQGADVTEKTKEEE